MKRSRSLIFLVTSIYVLAVPSFGRTSEADILKLQHAYFDAIMAKKYDLAVDSLAQGYRGVYSGGIIDRESETKDIRNFPLTAYEMTNEKVTFPTASFAVATFHLHVKVTVQGKDFFEDDNVASVWQRRGKKWRMVSQAAAKVQTDK